MAKASDTLPNSLPPRGLTREQAAAYIGVGASTFDKLVSDGVMPRPVEFGRRRVWDRLALDAAFGALSGTVGADAPDSNPWARLE